MGGIAEVLLNEGYQISGSDLADNAVTKRLQKLGVDIKRGHDANHISGADAVVRSMAIHDNPELIAARQGRIPGVPRGRYVGRINAFSLWNRNCWNPW